MSSRLLTAKKWWLLCSLLAAFVLAGAGLKPAQSSSQSGDGLVSESLTPLSPDMESISKQGFHALYSMDYKSARKQFEQMIQKDSRHPAGYVYLASAIWLEHLAGMRRLQTQIYNRSNAFFRQQKDSVDPAVEKLFYSTAEKGLVRAKLRLQKDTKDLVGLYYLGTGHGAIAGYESTVKRSFLSSLRHGTEATDAHRKVLKHHPQLTDAYLSVGLYNYVLGKLPTSVKILMFLGGIHGSKEEGLKQLEKAFKHGRLAKDEAAVLLVVLYDREKRHAEALKLLQQLTAKYPENPVFQFESATMSTKLGRFDESKKIYEKLFNEPAARTYLLDFIHFEYAELLFSTGTWEKAHIHYLNSRRVMRQTPVGLITMSHLRAGQCLDAMGRKDEAALEYGYVLKQPEIQGSRILARRYLKQPYHSGNRRL